MGTVKYIDLGKDEYEIMLEIANPTAEDGGDYKCLMKNDMGQLQAKLNLNIEAEPAPSAPVGQAPTFIEKPKIVTKEDGKLIMLIVKYRAEEKCECKWSFKESIVSETSTRKVVHERVEEYWESRIELTDPAPENAGLYKCVVHNRYGEINANLSLNIEVAPVIRERPIIKRVEKKKSVVLQCSVAAEQDIEVQWFKEGQAIQTTKDSRFSVEKKKSTTSLGETIVELEIRDTDVSDQGNYQLVAKSETGETQSQTVTLKEDQVKMEAIEGSTEAAAGDAEETTVKKKKKKVVKKEKKKEVEKEVKPPELSSYLKNFIKKEGEQVELKCRLEDEMEEGSECTVKWFLNDVEFQSSDRILLSFDGIYASCFIAKCTMEDQGEYKVVFENSAGKDESVGKITVKPDEEKKVE